MKIHTRPVAGNKLPSRFQIGDKVLYTETFGGKSVTHRCRIVSVIFSKEKVRYDVADENGNMGPRVDSVFIEPDHGLACGTTHAPKGWFCTRDPGHEGPCAAWKVAEEPSALDRMAAKYGGKVVKPDGPPSKTPMEILDLLRAKVARDRAAKEKAGD